MPLVQCQTNWQPQLPAPRATATTTTSQPARRHRHLCINCLCMIVVAWLPLLSFPVAPLPTAAAAAAQVTTTGAPTGSSFVGSFDGAGTARAHRRARAFGRAYRIAIPSFRGSSGSSSSTGRDCATWVATKSASRLNRRGEEGEKGDKVAQAQRNALPTRVNDTFVDPRGARVGVLSVARAGISMAEPISTTTSRSLAAAAVATDQRAIRGLAGPSSSGSSSSGVSSEPVSSELTEKRRTRCRTESECAKVARSRRGNSLARSESRRCCCACPRAARHSDAMERRSVRAALNPHSDSPPIAQDTTPGAVRSQSALASHRHRGHETKSANCCRFLQCDLFTCDSPQTESATATTTITTFTIGLNLNAQSAIVDEDDSGAKLASDQKLTTRRKRTTRQSETSHSGFRVSRNFKEAEEKRGRVAPDHAHLSAGPPPVLAAREFQEDEQTSEQLVELLAEFYAHTRHALDRYERLLGHWARLNASSGVGGVQSDPSSNSSIFNAEGRAELANIQEKAGEDQPEVASRKQQINESSKTGRRRQLLIKMLAGADEESLERWLHLRQLEYARLKNMSIELVSERPNGTIHVCADGPKILLLPNVSDLLYCYTRDQWIARMWSDSLRMSSFHYPIILLNILIFLFGTTGNIFVCLSVKRNHQLRSVTNYFIVNLAFADFLVILICLPATVVWDLTLTWFFGTIPCKLIMFLQDVSISVSVLTLTAISIDRYYAICHPLKFKTSLNQAKHMIALIWLVSLLIMAPDLVYLSAKPSADLAEAGLETVLYNDCNYDWSDDASRAFQFVKTVLLYLVPFLLMFCAHYRIAQVLRMASSMMMAMSDGGGGGSENGHAHTDQTALDIEQAQPLATQTAPVLVARGSTDATPTQSRDTPPADASTPDSTGPVVAGDHTNHHNHRRHHRKCRNHHLHSGGGGGDGHHHSRRHHHHHHHHHHHKHRCKRAPELTSCSATSSSSTTNQQQQVVVAVADRQQVALGAAPAENGISEKSNRRLRFAGASGEPKASEKRVDQTEPPLVKSARRLLPNRNLLINGLTSGGGDKQSRDYLKKQRIIADLLLKRESSFDWGPSGECGSNGNNPKSSPAVVYAPGICQLNNNNKPRRQLRKVSCSLDTIKTTTANHNNTGGGEPSSDATGRATSESAAVVAAKRPTSDEVQLPLVKPPTRSLSISAATAAAVASARQKVNQEQKRARAEQQQQKQQQRQRGASTYTHCDSNSANAFILTMHNKSKLESRKRAAKMLTAIVILFGICYLPVHLINFLRQFIDDIPQTDVTSTISMLAHCVCYLNSAINPFIYNHMNSVFRAEFKKFLSCLDWRRHSSGRQQQQQQTNKLKPALKMSQHALAPSPPHDHFQLAPLYSAGAHKPHPVARAQMNHEINNNNNNNNNNKDERAKATGELATNMPPANQSSGGRPLAPPPARPTLNGHIPATETRTRTTTTTTTTTTTNGSKAIIAIDDDADDDTTTAAAAARQTGADAGPPPPATRASLAAVVS